AADTERKPERNGQIGITWRYELRRKLPTARDATWKKSVACCLMVVGGTILGRPSPPVLLPASSLDPIHTHLLIE
ncbi:hypothetical protein BO94DRAFT_261955, partial [Aspergillus sclerotioniger CBS 115572]